MLKKFGTRFAQKSKDNFVDASAYEVDDIGSEEQISVMRIKLKSLDTYIRTIQELAKSHGIDLN